MSEAALGLAVRRSFDCSMLTTADLLTALFQSLLVLKGSGFMPLNALMYKDLGAASPPFGV